MTRLLVLVSTLTFVAHDEGPALLRFKPPVGATAPYVVKVSSSGTLGDATTPVRSEGTTSMTLRVVSRTDGDTALETKMGPSKTVLSGVHFENEAGTTHTTNGPVGQTFAMVVDDRGVLKDGTQVRGVGVVNPMAVGTRLGAQGVVFPEGPVKVGDTWTVPLDLGKQSGLKVTGTIPVVYRLVGLSGEGEERVAKIVFVEKGSTTVIIPNASASLPRSETRIEASGTFVLNATTGLLRSMNGASDTTNTLFGKGNVAHTVVSVESR